MNTLCRMLEERARQDGARRAFTFLDGAGGEESIDYAELDRRARAVAATLQEIADPGARILLLYPPGFDYIAALFGCLYARLVPVPVYPPDLAQAKRSLPRLEAIARDAEADLCATVGPILSLAGSLAGAAPQLTALHWVATDGLPPGTEDRFTAAPAAPGDLAWLQYTSGSTGTPKGVMLRHDNILHNSQHIARAFGHGRDSVGVIWLPPYHDMGLIGGIIQPIYVGFPTVLLSPLTFLKRPAAWLEAITRFRATTSGGPNFAYDLCVRRVAGAERAALDLGSWDLAFNGAEPVRSDTLRRFSEAFAPAGFHANAFYPCYGLAEGSLIVSGGTKGRAPVELRVERAGLAAGRVVDDPSPAGKSLVGCGGGLSDQTLVIAEPHGAGRLGPGQVGEIALAGPSVAAGYWRRDEETAQVFGARIDGEPAPLLRTGDLGFLREGELFIAGRLRDLIIVRGQNHYPQDLERTVEECHPAMRRGCGAAFAVDGDEGEELVIVQEVAAFDGDPEELLGRVRQAVSEAHGLEARAVALARAGTLPKTPSGKIQRYACRDAWQSGALDLVGRWSQAPRAANGEVASRAIVPGLPGAAAGTVEAEVLAWLRAQLAEEFGLPAAEIDVERPISFFGLDSRRAADLLFAAESEWDIRLAVTVLLEKRSIRSIAEEIARAVTLTGGASEQPPVLVALQPQGARRPFFCIHSASGAVTCYAEVARAMHALGADRPFHALQPIGINGDRDPLTEIDAMADCYIDAIRSIQSSGPYLLGGWSAGGLIAYHIARKLEGRGERASGLVMFDTWSPGTLAQADQRVRFLLAAHGVQHMAKQRGRELPYEQALERIERERTGSFAEGIALMFSILREQGVIPPDGGSMFRVYRAMMGALERYRVPPGQYAGAMTLFRSQSMSPVIDRTYNWSRLVAAPIEVVDVPAHHYAIFNREMTDFIAPRLRDWLDAVDRQEPAGVFTPTGRAI